MEAHSVLCLLWRTFGGVVGVSALIGLACAIGWAHQRLIGAP
jgi:hypothetical protein